VLGGLGIKGAANIGALQSLCQHKVKIKKIVAAGVSSLAGAQFALERDLNLVTDNLVRFFAEHERYLWGLEELGGLLWSRRRRAVGSFSYFLRERLFCKANLKRLNILSWDLVEGELEKHFGDIAAYQLKVPLAVSAIDLRRGKETLLEEEKLVERLKAGIAFPGLFPPVRIGERELVSSSLYCELPLGSLTEADRPIVAIDIPSALSVQRPRSLIEVIAHVDELRGAAIKQKFLSKADKVFCLEVVKGFWWGSYRQTPQLVSRAREEMDRLLGLMS